MAAGLVGRLTRCHTRALRFASYFLWSTPCSMGETGDSYSSDSHKNGMGLDGWCHASLQALTKYTSTKYYIYSLPFLPRPCSTALSLIQLPILILFLASSDTVVYVRVTALQRCVCVVVNGSSVFSDQESSSLYLRTSASCVTPFPRFPATRE